MTGLATVVVTARDKLAYIFEPNRRGTWYLISSTLVFQPALHAKSKEFTDVLAQWPSSLIKRP